MHLVANAIIVLWGWRRVAAAFAAGAIAALALPPWSAFPVLWLSVPVLVWLIDGAVASDGAGLLRRLVPAALVGWGFGFGYNLDEHLNLGLAFNWRSINYQATAVDADDPSRVVHYGSRLDISTLGLTGDWNILPGGLTPYIHGELAWMIVDTNIFADWGSSCWWDPWWGYRCGGVPVHYGKNTGAYTLGLGGRFHVTNSFFVRVGYEHIWLGIDTVDGSDMLRIDLGLMN